MATAISSPPHSLLPLLILPLPYPSLPIPPSPVALIKPAEPRESRRSRGKARGSQGSRGEVRGSRGREEGAEGMAVSVRRSEVAEERSRELNGSHWSRGRGRRELGEVGRCQGKGGELMDAPRVPTGRRSREMKESGCWSQGEVGGDCRVPRGWWESDGSREQTRGHGNRGDGGTL